MSCRLPNVNSLRKIGRFFAADAHSALCALAVLGCVAVSAPAPAIPPGAEVQDTQRDTVLASLRDTGFVTYQPSDHLAAANAALHGKANHAGARILVVAFRMVDDLMPAAGL